MRSDPSALPAHRLFDLSGRVALVTGSNRGIGRAIALGLAECGAALAIHCASRLPEAESVARTITPIVTSPRAVARVSAASCWKRVTRRSF